MEIQKLETRARHLSLVRLTRVAVDLGVVRVLPVSR